MELTNLKVVYEESEFISMLEVNGIQEDQEYIEVLGVFTPEIFANYTFDSSRAFRIGYKKCILCTLVDYSSYNRREPDILKTTYWVMEDFYDKFVGAYKR